MKPDRPKDSETSTDVESDAHATGAKESDNSQATAATVIVPIPEPKQSSLETAVAPMPRRPQSHTNTAVAARKPAPVTAQPHDLGPGDLLGVYRIVRLLGEGGMGKVFLAEHERLGRQVAIKLLHAEYAGKPEAVSRFFAEARAVNRIRDEHIVEITDFVEDGDHTYCVMEYIEGADLAELLADARPLPTARVIDIGVQISGVLAKVHEAGMIHRDLKPANVFISERDGHDLVKVLDFGVAKMWRTEDPTPLNLTAEGIVVGTPEYMSPEQAKNEVPDHRVDVYALGLVLYAALTGRPPFTASSYAEMLVMHLTVAPPTPSEVLAATRGKVPASLEALILDCLEKNREDRPADMHEVRSRLVASRAELESGASPPAKSTGPSAAPKKPFGRRGSVIGAGVAAMAVCLAVALLVFSPFGSRHSEKSSGDAPVASGLPSSDLARPVETPADDLEGATGPGEGSPSAPSPLVEIVLNSRPAGARVLRGDSMVHIGETPLTLEVERSETPEVFRFELAGHESISERIPLDESTRLSVILPRARPRVRAPAGRTPRPDAATSQKAPSAKATSPKTETPAEAETRPETPELINPFGD